MSRPGNLRDVANLIEQQDRQFYHDINDLLDAMGVPRREPVPGCKVVRLHPRPISENAT